MNIDPLCFISVTPVDDEIHSSVDAPAIGINRAAPAKYSDSMKSCYYYVRHLVLRIIIILSRESW